MLKKIRIALSVIFLVFFTVIFMGVEGFSGQITRAASYFQLIPVIVTVFGAFSAAALAGLLFILVMTLIFGRVYCSSLCPLGTFQDFFINLKYRRKKKARFFKYSQGRTALRSLFTAAAFGLFIFGAGFLIILFDPYSIYGRFVSGIIKPGAEFIMNGPENILAEFHIYNVPHIKMHSVSVYAAVFAFITAAAIAAAAFYKGRIFCNTLCPAGGILALISRFSFFRIRINRDICGGCGKCETVCKASCINAKERIIDFERCIVCFNCIDTCPQKNMAYSAGSLPETAAESSGEKRRDIIRAAVAGAVLLLPGRRLLAEFSGGPVPIKKTLPAAPPGAGSIERFNKLCTSCHLCASACPQNVIGVAFGGYGLSGILQPKLDFSKSYCLYDCIVCTQVCPTGALLPLTVQEKKRTQIGAVHLEKRNCISYVDREPCTVCTEHCPVKAVYSVNYNGVPAPEINTDICIGCGACEYVCPALPYKAIYVEGHTAHGRAKDPEKYGRGGQWENKTRSIKRNGKTAEEDFPF
ncbi:MAG: 4Fe-4S dicluster domain-containing protein [Candidatus Goldiibacteriota bacterium]